MQSTRWFGAGRSTACQSFSPATVARKSCCPFRRGKHRPSFAQHASAGVVKVVKVMVVAQQHIINKTDRLGVKGWANQFAQGRRRGFVFSSGGTEGWIGQQSHSTKFQKTGRAAYVGDSELMRFHEVIADLLRRGLPVQFESRARADGKTRKCGESESDDSFFCVLHAP